MTQKPTKLLKGSLEVICGSMFSGKSEELIRRIRRAQLAKLKVIVFKHSLDNNRTSSDHVKSHNGSLVDALPINDFKNIVPFIEDNQIDVIGIDEIQFFSQDIVMVICQLVDMGKRIVVAGLDLDFKGYPFGCVPILMAIADHVTKLKAICIDCGKEAHFTQRLVNGNPAKHDDALILIGAQEQYQARCRDCYKIDVRMAL